MDNETKNLSNYIKEKGFNLVALAKKTGISYTALYDSLVKESRDRDLRAGELMAICKFIEKDPMDFTEKNERPTN